MTRSQSRFAVVALVLAGAGLALPARADAIDGNWCHADGRRMSIQGSQMVTPGGNRLEGRYSRHHFAYTVPTSEPAAGQLVDMTLLDEYTVHVRTGTEGAPETWKRCAASVS